MINPCWTLTWGLCHPQRQVRLCLSGAWWGGPGLALTGAGSDRGSTRRIELEEWEHVTCMKTVSLRSEETVSGLKGYVAAGTCLMQGEEVTCRGRVSGQQGFHSRQCPAP